MKKLLFTFLLFMFYLFQTEIVSAQILMSSSGSYSQDFNTLASSGTGTWTDNSSIPNWFWQSTATGTTYTVDNGSSNSGGRKSYGTTASTDRAMGSLGSGSATVAYGILLKNTSGGTITDIKISYTGEQWRNGGNTSVQPLSFFYKTSTSVITDLTPSSNTNWTPFTSLNFSSLINTSTAAALDGNASANKTIFTDIPITGITINNDEYLMLRWQDVNDAGNDHGLSIDDITITWTISNATAPPSLTANTTNNSVDNSFDISFTDDATWRAAIISVNIGSSTLTQGTDYEILPGILRLKPQGLNPLLTTSGSKSISISATGYLPATLTQEIKSGDISLTNSSVSISGLFNTGISRTVTATAKDQYSNAITGYQFKYDFSYTNDDITTQEIYTIDSKQYTSNSTDSLFTNLTGSNGSATLSVAIPVIVDPNDGFSLQIQLNDGSTNIGNLLSFTKLPPEITFTCSDPATTILYPSSSRNLIYQAKIVVLNDSSRLTLLNVNLSGSYTSTSIKSNGFKLIYSSNSTLDASDTPIDSVSSFATGSGELLQFINVSKNFTVGTAYLFVTVDIESNPILNETISAFISGNSSFNFGSNPSYGTGSFTAGLGHTIKPSPTMTELIVPKYFGAKTASSANTNRTPFAACLKFENLIPNTTYNLKSGIDLTTAAATSFGAGQMWDGSAFSTNNLANAFTTDNDGNSAPVWIFLQPTGNASRFGGGQIHNIRIGVYTGATAPGSPTFVGSKTVTSLDIASTPITTDTTDDGAFLYGTSPLSASKYILVYDNESGTGDPLYAYQIRPSAPTQSTQTNLPREIDSVFMQVGTTIAGNWVAVIPGMYSGFTGVKRIESRNADNTVYAYNIDTDGIWPSGVNTSTALRKDVITITETDAKLDPNPFKRLNINVLLQGSYDASISAMRAAVDDLGNYVFSPTITDTISIEFRDATTPTTIISSFNSRILYTNGTCIIDGIPASLNDVYYVVIKHRNHLETWSSSPVSFSSDIINYDFTISSSQAYGNNLAELIPGVWGIIGGDTDRSGFIDSDDMNIVDNNNYNSGYLDADADGNGFVDSDDMNIVDNNNYIGTVTP